MGVHLFTVLDLLGSNETLLALLSHGFNQPVSEGVLQRLSSRMRDLYCYLRELCPLQVDFDSLFFECDYERVGHRILLANLFTLSFFVTRLRCMEG